jgi:hypothetical protein
MQDQELLQLHRRTNLEEVIVKKLYGVPLQLTLEQEQVFFVAYSIILLLQPPTIQVAILPIHITLCFQSLFLNLYAGSGTTSNVPEDQSGEGDSEEIQLDLSGGDLDDSRDFMRTPSCGHDIDLQEGNLNRSKPTYVFHA